MVGRRAIAICGGLILRDARKGALLRMRVCQNPHGEERGNAARLEPGGTTLLILRRRTSAPSRRMKAPHCKSRYGLTGDAIGSAMPFSLATWRRRSG